MFRQKSQGDLPEEYEPPKITDRCGEAPKRKDAGSCRIGANGGLFE
ncbi:hypothetical protein RMSM_00620 [Rhodopirellula maiorica SM1]|uniref:Uncharacterized protein n=1 Tax=Rhodopirellula maiorica SM1 TaxID=1265738 RepID=M5RT34_9BACT|nr:hypothetical protein RMSM_00620 [Rhodopirellula maiorica SM1]